MKNNLFLDLHVLQNVPPSCINRDDTGSPKTAVYGGTIRARVSSQAWKKAMREMFKDEFDAEKLGHRTRKLSYLMQKELEKINPLLEKEKIEGMVNKILGIEKIKDKVLFFVSSKQINATVKIANKYIDEFDFSEKEKKNKNTKDKGKNEIEKRFKEELDNAMSENPSIDIMLFGRMSADNVNLNYDAAAQVAHAISTHAVNNEYDYFTACDDIEKEDESGAAHLGTVEYNSSTLYRYATVNIGELFDKDKLNDEEVIEIVKGFTNAFVKSMPTGKQNTFANRTLPYFVYVTLRKDQPINFVGAFEKAIRKSEEGFADKSEDAFIKEVGSVYENYNAEPIEAFVVGGKDNYKIGKKVKYNDLVEQLMNAVNDELRKED